MVIVCCLWCGVSVDSGCGVLSGGRAGSFTARRARRGCVRFGVLNVCLGCC